MPLHFSYNKPKPEPKKPGFGARIGGESPQEAKLLGARFEGDEIAMGDLDTDLTEGLTEHEARILCSNLARAYMMFAGAAAMLVENSEKTKGDGSKYVLGIGSYTMYRTVVGAAMKCTEGEVCDFERFLATQKKGKP